MESIINRTIKKCEQNNLGIFHKKEVPINFSGIHSKDKSIVLEKAWIKSKSTTDYYGVFAGRFITFEAKSTHSDMLPLGNIKPHQLNYLNNVVKHDGVAFVIVAFLVYEEFFAFPIQHLSKLRKKAITIQDARNLGISLTLIYPGVFNLIEAIKEIMKTSVL